MHLDRAYACSGHRAPGHLQSSAQCERCCLAVVEAGLEVDGAVTRCFLDLSARSPVAATVTVAVEIAAAESAAEPLAIVDVGRPLSIGPARHERACRERIAH
jgi:hypothetical protein